MGITNKLIIASAGSGKTTFLIDEALKKKDANILITTYTIANEEEIRRKFIKKIGYVPTNVTLQTWFSFLMQHCIKPFQGHFNKDLSNYQIKGLLQVNSKSAVKYKDSKGRDICYKESELKEHYFSKGHKIYSDKLSKFAVGGGDQFRKTSERKQFVALVMNRLSRIYTNIFIDEVQDLAGYDLEFLKLLFESSIDTLLVCDPRQVTYLTHHEQKHNKYKDGKIKEFITAECKKYLKNDDIDETSLMYSHRNNSIICKFSSKLFPQYSPSEPCQCYDCRKDSNKLHQGIYLVKAKDIENYLHSYKPTQLRYDKDVKVSERFQVMNFGASKGLTFERVLIYPTNPFIKWLKDNSFDLKPTSRSKLYVALTRANYSVGIVCDEDINDIDVFTPSIINEN